MKKLAILLVLILLLAPYASAQVAKYDAGIFYDQAGTVWGFPLPFTQFPFYAMAFDLEGEVKGYEFGVTIPAEITVLGSTPNPPTALNLGPAPTNWIVGTGLCMPDLPGQWFPMVTFTGLLLSPPADLLICMTAATPSSFEPGGPGYLRCDGSLQALDLAVNEEGFSPDGCMLLGSPPIANASASWGEVKARF